MMKKYFISGAMLLCSIVHSQVGIGSNVTIFDNSEVLKIVASNKGVLFPKFLIPDLAFAPPVTNPATSLMVYNTNIINGKGYYIWQNKWNPLINSANVYKYLGIIKTVNAKSNATLVDSTPNGANSYSLGESPAAHDWILIPNLSTTVTVYSPNNNVSINVDGIVQVNSTAAITRHSYAAAIFIDNKLASARNFIISGNSTCLYHDFNVFLSASNLAVGTHTIAVYETYRVNLSSTTGAKLYFGGKLNTCSNLSDDMSRSFLNIQSSEKP